MKVFTDSKWWFEASPGFKGLMCWLMLRSVTAAARLREREYLVFTSFTLLSPVAF